MPFTRRMLAGDIVKEALGLQGLPVPNAVASNTNDLTVRQMWVMLRSQGRRLCKPTMTHRWQALKREWVLDTIPGQTLYDLPADHDSFLDLTGWNKTSRLPMLGPATDAQWQQLSARALGSSTISVIYRVIEDKFELYNSYTSPQQLSIMYNSRGWVRLAASLPGAPQYSDEPVEDGDTVMLDPEMMVAAVQYGFMSAKGFDTTQIAALLQGLTEAAINADQDAPVLTMAQDASYPLLTTQFNVPDTGYGG